MNTLLTQKRTAHEQRIYLKSIKKMTVKQIFATFSFSSSIDVTRRKSKMFYKFGLIEDT